MKLLPQQARLLGFVVAYWRRHLYPPSTREIMEALEIHSESQVRWRLAQLQQLGLLEIRPRQSRAINIGPTIEALIDERLTEHQLEVQQWHSYWSSPSPSVSWSALWLPTSSSTEDS